MTPRSSGAPNSGPEKSSIIDAWTTPRTVTRTSPERGSRRDFVTSPFLRLRAYSVAVRPGPVDVPHHALGEVGLTSFNFAPAVAFDDSAPARACGRRRLLALPFDQSRDATSAAQPSAFRTFRKMRRRYSSHTGTKQTAALIQVCAVIGRAGRTPGEWKREQIEHFRRQ